MRVVRGPAPAHARSRVGQSAAAQVESMIRGAAQSQPKGILMSVVGIAVVLFGASGAFAALQDAMSREAQAAREKAARVILAEAEVEIAARFAHAAESYRDNPTALHLRAMNMLYEGLKEKGALMLVPSSAVESMGMGGLTGAAALRQQTLTGSKETPE